MYAFGAYNSVMMNEKRRFNSSTDEMWRLFIAVPLPSDVREIVGEIEETLTPLGWPVRWVDPGLAHITLKFLGDTRADCVPMVERELSPVAARGQVAEAVVGNVGAFPSKNKARVIWLGLDGDLSQLAGLAQNVDHAMARMGFAAEARPFRPHITVGRLRQGKNPPVDFGDAVNKLDIPRMRVPIDRIQLVRSVLGRARPTYITLSEWPLRMSSNENVITRVELVEHG
ncbi:RNA 2',3'-cyclic phosphodiesterase [soil metagenome]